MEVDEDTHTHDLPLAFCSQWWERQANSSGGHSASRAYELDAAVDVPAVDHVVSAEVRQQHATVKQRGHVFGSRYAGHQHIH